MEQNQYLRLLTSYLDRLSSVINTIDKESIARGVALVSDAWLSGKQIFTMGNGGSAHTAMHFITDWNKSLFITRKVPFHGRSLLDNIGLVTAYGNDISFQDIFVEQLKNLLKPGDLIIAISGSGNSENVLRAVQYGNDNGAVTLGLCGYNGGKLKKLAQFHVWVNVNDMQLTEDVHAIFGHIVLQSLSEHIAG